MAAEGVAPFQRGQHGAQRGDAGHVLGAGALALSCPPPMISGVNGAPARTYSMPMPLGAYSLWPENGA
jgi:hypothetical protein